MNINDKIISVAEEFEGLVEIVSNETWDNPTTKGRDPEADRLKMILKRAGHQNGWPYCASFCEGVWVTAYEDLKVTTGILAQIQGILTPHVMTSYRNAKAAGLITMTPERGAIAFMQKGSSDSGHEFLVCGVEGTTIKTIEGNTSPSPSDIQADRDGGIGTGGIWRKRRLFNTTKSNGLWIRGFMNPIKIQ